MERLTANDIKVGIVWSQTGLVFLSYAHMILVAAWAAGGLLNGFSNGIFHVPPIVIEIVLIKILADTLGFGVNTSARKFVLDTQMKHRMIRLVWVLLVIAIGINITHLIFTGIELAECATTICMDAYWFLFTFAFILGLLIVFEVIMFGYFIKYDKHVKLLRLFLNKKYVNP